MRTRADASLGLDPRSFTSILETFVADLKARWYSKALVKHARTALGRFFAYLRSRRIRDIRAVGEAEVFAYARALATTKSAVTGSRSSGPTDTDERYPVEIPGASSRTCSMAWRLSEMTMVWFSMPFARICESTSGASSGSQP